MAHRQLVYDQAD